MAEKKNFALRNENGEEVGVFTGRQPRQAALKAARRLGGTKDNPVTIRLREKGTKKVHVFEGWVEIVDAPANRPAWMPPKIKKAHVRKIGIETLEKL
ncbi:chromosomal protein MC1 [Methanosarcinales archaeon]|nr:MAG: chromosomal protein MC1 [Methanosarcinales archaeon]